MTDITDNEVVDYLIDLHELVDVRDLPPAPVRQLRPPRQVVDVAKFTREFGGHLFNLVHRRPLAQLAAAGITVAYFVFMCAGVALGASVVSRVFLTVVWLWCVGVLLLFAMLSREPTGENEMNRTMEPIDVAHAALLEAGRADLADCIIGFDDGDGFYLEVLDWELGVDDLAVIDRAECLARQSVGLPPITRSPD